MPVNGLCFCTIMLLFSIINCGKFLKKCCGNLCEYNNSLGRKRTNSGKYWDTEEVEEKKENDQKTNKIDLPDVV